MADAPVRFDLLLDQRYYYFVVLAITSGFPLASYWTQVGNTSVPSEEPPGWRFGDSEIQHRWLTSNDPYSRGQLLETVSGSGDGEAPYVYDLFALTTVIGGASYAVFAFPFAALARDLINKVISSRDLRRRGDLLKTDVSRLIEQAGAQLTSGPVTGRIRALQVVVVDDPAATPGSLLLSIVPRVEIHCSSSSGGDGASFTYFSRSSVTGFQIPPACAVLLTRTTM